MIINPKYGFIFFKPMKVGGSSIEKALSAYSCKNTLITGSNKVGSSVMKMISEKGINNFDHAEYGHRNNLYKDKEGNVCTRFHSHTSPDIFYDKISNKDIFKNFKHVTVIRNPWDSMLSYYWFNLLGFKETNLPLYKQFAIYKSDPIKKARKKFKNFIKYKEFTFPQYDSEDNSFEGSAMNYIAKSTNRFLSNKIDEYMIYERGLNSEYKRVFQGLIKDEWLKDLPHLKSNYKKIKKHYSFYFDDESKSIVSKANSELIEKFGYIYENKH